MVKIAPYGAWTSPIDAAQAAAADRAPIWVDRHGEHVWWAESRPEEGGRVVLLRARPGEDPEEVLPGVWNVRNRVHEYGGRPWVVLADGRVAFTHWDDQRVYLAEPGGTPEPITSEPEREHGLRYADLTAGPGGAQVWCVRERVTGDRPTDVARELVSIDVDGQVRELARSHRFLTAPKVSPDGAHAVWIGWNHPDMPWDANEVCVAEVTDAGFGPHRVLCGGGREAACQVEWDGPGAVLALTDPDGWWNLFRIGLDGTKVNLAPCEQELGGALWKLGQRWFAPLGGGRHAVLRSGALAILDERSATVTDVDVDLPVWTSNLVAADGVLVSSAAGPTADLAVVTLDLSTGELTALTGQSPHLPDPAYLPVPEQRWFPDEHGRRIPAYVYPPTNPDFAAPEGELPPYVVYVHGGPTSKVNGLLDLEFSFLTSRGIGVVAVNYGGSTGYGRAFREELLEGWGVVDVRDCAAVATALAAEGSADGQRLAISGGSAGGWTGAASMTSVDTYRCGTVLYPILDLTGWTAEGGETHDFESEYVRGLVGALPEHADRYARRSPINHVDKLAGPVLLMQGLEDQVCPPEQADRFVKALDGSGIPHAYLTFAGEQHGFRKADTITAALLAELSFYGQVFGFEPVDTPRLELRT